MTLCLLLKLSILYCLVVFSFDLSGALKRQGWHPAAETGLSNDGHWLCGESDFIIHDM